MKKKIIYIALIIIFIIALLITAIKGLNVNLKYAQGHTITFTVGKEVKLDEIEQIAKNVFIKNEFIVQKVELFDDSVLIKTRDEVTAEQLETLCNKINEKYEVELTMDSFEMTYETNVRLRNVIEPYIIPIGLSTLLILGYYAVRYKGAKKMLELLKYLIISEGLLYSLYAIGRVQVNELTMPIGLIVYTLVITIYTAMCEKNMNNKATKSKK